jgi:hypothetical protein
MNDRKAHLSRGLARYLRRQLALARRSGDPRRIAAAEAEAAAVRLAATRSSVAGHVGGSTSTALVVDRPENAVVPTALAAA